MISNTSESAKFICRELYNFFVYYKITPDVETNVITPLAQVLQESGYDIKTVLSTLFKSEHFFTITYSGACIIKSPLDFLLGLCREYGVQMPAANDDASNYSSMANVVAALNCFATGNIIAFPLLPVGMLIMKRRRITSYG